jgi:hypothetical protein
MLISSTAFQPPEHGDMTRDDSAVPRTTTRQEQKPAPTAVTEIASGDLAHPQTVLLAEQRAHRELAILAGQCPDHLLGMECYPGRARRYIARAKPGTTATPWLVISTDISELRAALIPPPTG